MTRIGHVLIWLCLVSVCYAEDPFELVSDVKQQQQQGPPANSNVLPAQLQHPAVPGHTPSNHRATTNKKDGQVDVSQRKLDADQVILDVAQNWKSKQQQRKQQQQQEQQEQQEQPQEQQQQQQQQQPAETEAIAKAHALHVLMKSKQELEAAKQAEDDLTQTITQGSHPQSVLKNQRQKNPSQDDMDNTTQLHKTSKQNEADKSQQAELEEINPAQKELETKEENENKKQEPETGNQPQEKQDKDASPQTLQQTPQKQEQETSSENQTQPDKPDTSVQLDADPSSTKQDKLSSQTQTQTQADAPKPQLNRKQWKQHPQFQGMARESKAEEVKKEEHGQAQVQAPDETNRLNGRTAPEDLIAKALGANQAQSQSQSQAQAQQQTGETEKETENGVKKIDNETTEDSDKEKEKQIKSQQPEKSQIPPSALFAPKHTPVTPQPRSVDRADTDIHASVPNDETEQGKKRHGRKSDEKEITNKKKQDQDEEIKDETLTKNKEKDDDTLTKTKEKDDDTSIKTDDMGNKPKSKEKDESIATKRKHRVDPDNDQTNQKQQPPDVYDAGNPKSKPKTEPEEDITSNKGKTSGADDEKDANTKSAPDESTITTTTKLKPVSGSGDDDSTTTKKQSDNESIINNKDDKEAESIQSETTIKQDDKLIEENIKLKNENQDLNNKLKELQKQIQLVRKQKEEDALKLEKAHEAAKLAQQQLKIEKEKVLASADAAARETKLKDEEKESAKDEKESDEQPKEEKDTDTSIETENKPHHAVPPIMGKGPPIMVEETIMIVTKRKDGDNDAKVSEDIKSDEKSETLESVETDKTDGDKEKKNDAKADPASEEPVYKYRPISPDDIPTRSSPPYRLILILSLILFCVYVIRRVRRILDGDDFQTSDERTPKAVQIKNAISSALHSHDQPSSDLSLTPSPPSHARGISSGMSLKPSLPTKKPTTTTTTTTTEHTKPTVVESDTTDSFAGWDDNWSDMDTGTSETATTTTTSNNSMSVKPKASARGGIKKSILAKE